MQFHDIITGEGVRRGLNPKGARARRGQLSQSKGASDRPSLHILRKGLATDWDKTECREILGTWPTDADDGTISGPAPRGNRDTSVATMSFSLRHP
jgi:hypothetical protein